MDQRTYAALLASQSGVASRRQLHDASVAPHDLKRLLRRRELVRLHDGIFIDHTGTPTWLQRAWAGVLLAWPAALCDESALRADEGPGRTGRDDRTIHVAVDRQRSLAVPAGYRLHRLAGFDDLVQWNRSPPRVRIEEALIAVAARRPGDLDAIAVLADAISARRTTPERLGTCLAERRRIPRRAFLRDVLADLDHGTCSVLEHGYLTRVERPHGLPVAARQVRDSLRGPLYRDVVYTDLGQVVELDGRLWHDSVEARDADLDRDLDAAVSRLGTVRLGWGQVYARPCRTAARVGELLTARGWGGRIIRCAACPEDLPMAG
ncbi:type IV toxin-antitoxin system AbiEi family antitoxin domain-containing protein [Nocardioides sp. J2M5]|uniref:type IV toxin-antitoxin system AbiEi family antitoxin domain-containing protein n=1 Tax=Nocardioides palaemonis TaxID=2829810 RepID=UPI001BA9BDAB|nr:type IV toxin-antitoxin system AbiEi family antitoxin domain-containing protein [Nocardioides palaemonis]MBS2936543.1 type IV toxin-antitoxin system AbiEi family antitoxin domain-containing protein [Nocardioides palaemonis]